MITLEQLVALIEEKTGRIAPVSSYGKYWVVDGYFILKE